MRTQATALAAVVFSFFLVGTSLADSGHGGPDFDPSEDFNSTSPPDTFDGRAQTLVPIDSLIEPAVQAVLEAGRVANLSYLDRLAREGRRVAVDLRFRDTEVRKQFGGTCTAFGLLGAMENLLGGQTDLSERHFWSQYRQYSSAAAVRTASTKWGVVEHLWWPNTNRNPYYGYLDQPWFKLSQHESLEADISKAVASLDAGNPVYIALSTPADMMNCSIHIDPNTVQYKKSGHALAVVGYETDPAAPGGGSFLLKNSWGSKCGDKGYQWFPFSLCAKKGMYCQFWSVQGVIHD